MSWEEAIKTCENKGNNWRLLNRQELLKLYKNKSTLKYMNSGICWSSEENPDPLVPAKTYAYGITSMTENNAYITDDYTYSNNNVRAVK
jgi:hypothetical protein